MVVTGIEIPSPVIGIVEFKRFELLDSIRLSTDGLRHGEVKLLAHDRAIASLDDDLFVIFFDRLERPYHADPCWER